MNYLHFFLLLGGENKVINDNTFSFISLIILIIKDCVFLPATAWSPTIPEDPETALWEAVVHIASSSTEKQLWPALYSSLAIRRPAAWNIETESMTVSSPGPPLRANTSVKVTVCVCVCVCVHSEELQRHWGQRNGPVTRKLWRKKTWDSDNLNLKNILTYMCHLKAFAHWVAVFISLRWTLIN